MSISDEDKVVLRDLAKIAASVGIDFFVIGAGARFLLYDWPKKLAGGRGTTDWDIAVRVASWSEFERLKAALTGTGRFNQAAAEHRLEHVEGRRLDVVPFGGVESPDRMVAYPKGETTHSVLGLDECDARCEVVDLGEGVSVRAVVPPGLVVLKAQAYLERRPYKTHDVRDLNFVVETYLETLDDEVVFERAAEVLQDEKVLYEDAGAYILALDVVQLGLSNEVIEPLRRLVEELLDEASKAVDDVLVRDTEQQAQQRAEITRRYSAFRLGLLH